MTRSERVESWHRGALSVWHAGEPVLSIGAADEPIYARSAVKPLQALPLFERGVVERLELPVEERALVCASHDGARVHTDAARSLLARGGLGEADLQCGPHAPFARDARLEMLRSGAAPDRLHNNCSGKHAGFLHLAKDLGADTAGYLEPDGATQTLVREAVAQMADLHEPPPVGLDGCGAPTIVLPLSALAKAFCQLANPDGLPPVRAAACRSILHAVGEAPVLLAGEQRLCTALVRCWPGRAFAKNGAEGVYALALAPDPKRRRFPGAIGVAVKVDDGAERGYQPVVVDLLRWLGAFGPDAAAMPDALQRFWRPPIHNTQKLVVGEARCELDWEALR